MPWLSARSAAAYLDIGEVRFLVLVRSGRAVLLEIANETPDV
jgi:hypothetical protein